MEDLGDAQLSHRALSLSYRPETGRNVRVSAVSSSRTVELVPKNGRENAVDDERCRVRSSGQWSSANALDLPPRGYREKDSVEKDRWTVAARPVERAALADRGWQNAVGMLEGRSKSFVLPDRCLRRSASPIADNKSSANAVGSTLLPKATTITTDADRHRHQRHHHYYQHHHHHHHHHHLPSRARITLCYRHRRRRPRRRPLFTTFNHGLDANRSEPTDVEMHDRTLSFPSIGSPIDFLVYTRVSFFRFASNWVR